MNRAFYSFAWWLATPVLIAYLLRRSIAQPEYRRGWAQRWALAWPAKPLEGPVFWVHAVSVGETRAAEPLLRALLRLYPEYKVLLSHGTPTGLAVGQQWQSEFPERLQCVYLPYDYAYAQRRFFQRFQPRMGFIMETEVWPNLMHQAQELGMPVVLVNGRLSEKSLRKAQTQTGLIVPALRAFKCIGVQSAGDAQRLAQLGVSSQVWGNIKFDQVVNEGLVRQGLEWRQQWSDKKIVMLASARDGEEEQLLDALGLNQSILNNPSLLFALVPRHPQRFDEVAKLVQARGFRVLRRSSAAWLDAASSAQTPTILLGDSMGEMQAYYALADVAIMGGTLGDTGGQNLIEAAAVGCPTVLGPSRYNFAQACDLALEAGAAFSANGAQEAVQLASQLALDRLARDAASRAAKAFSLQHQGALAHSLETVARLLGSGV